jgi:uncharacterized protein (DUF1697 family)
MTRYVAFLRAINVGGHTVKMDRLRGLFTELKLGNVETFIASGNVLFDSAAASNSLEPKIEKHLAKSLGYDVQTFVRPVTALPTILSGHPFAARIAKAHGLYVGFLKGEPTKEQRARLADLASDHHSFHVNDRELYWLSQISMADTKITNATLEKAVGVSTFRSIVSLGKLAVKAGATA